MTVNTSWTIRGGRVITPPPFVLFGIVNVTPDSFSDGGKFATPEKAHAHALSLMQQGAAIVDLGAESSRPGAAPVSEAEEQARLMPVLQALLQDSDIAKAQAGTLCKATLGTDLNTNLSSNLGDAPFATCPLISIDTYHAATAAATLETGAHIINDISACQFDPALQEVVAHYKPGYVLMHSSGRPECMQEHIPSGPIMPHLLNFFEKKLQELTNAGLPEEHIMLDPGIGFGKSVEQNWEILQNMEALHCFGRPILAALSMKSFLHKELHIDVQDMQARAEATHVTTALLAHKGIAYHRVHHVQAAARALRIAHALRA